MDSTRTSQIKTAIRHISESMFVGLCHKVGTSRLVAMRRDVVDIRDVMENQKTPSNKNNMIESGSQKEGFRLEGSDIDIMFWPNNHRVIWELSQSQYYNRHRQTLILCDYFDSPPGFTLLCLLSPSMDRGIQEACVRVNNRQYLSSSLYRLVTSSVFPLNSTQHGPCASGRFGAIEYDHAHCFACDFWSPSASSWIDRCHSWPQPHVVDDIVKNGCHFVAIGHKLGIHEDLEWRISFSLAEQKLVFAMNHCQFLTYALLKLFLTEIINNGVGEDDKLLCSYHIKTAVFWVIQQNTISHWCPQNLLWGFWVCFKLILKWVYEGVCPNFFIPENNMFLNKIHGDKQYQLSIRLYGLYEKGLAFLLHSPSIRSYIIKVLHNPRLSICTDERTLISEAEFDINIFKEIYRQDTLFTSNLECCMRYLHTIEQMIDAPLLTEYQVIMLQKLTADVLKQTVFILHMKTNAYTNKLSYRNDKIYCHMLKLAAKFGYITDMLYLAMYYYKTLRYTKAMSITEMIKVKLAKPYVMNRFNVNKEMYTEAVGGLTWSKKMRYAVAWTIRLDNDIHYIGELIQEQMSAQLNNWPHLEVSPLILLYMLEILCYRHVNTMREQTFLRELQTLVHFDQGQLMDPLYKDISWQILGICQQVTGNLQAALYSYHQSLRQEPYNKIHIATEMRIREIFRWNSSIT
ncbi:uncharacterized protein LOC133174835 [Saccostrea echinata]|uniref:uncharacterized protein LOC133174835 n=1 Tax=Saccostrea echinata TaxID=191078 RepID=UPI002A80B4DA|nr:uncharacterized protein LOC133174835 [Saccostrea echinata]